MKRRTLRDSCASERRWTTSNSKRRSWRASPARVAHKTRKAALLMPMRPHKRVPSGEPVNSESLDGVWTVYRSRLTTSRRHSRKTRTRSRCSRSWSRSALRSPLVKPNTVRSANSRRSVAKCTKHRSRLKLVAEPGLSSASQRTTLTTSMTRVHCCHIRRIL